jgi:hypothetical protein
VGPRLRGKSVVESILNQCLTVLKILLPMLLVSAPLLSQGSAQITGTITDQTRGVIAGAIVVITDTSRGVSRALVTDGAGQYNAPNLLPGTYSVRAESKGFKVGEHSGITLEVSQELRVDVTLEAGEQSEKITVTGELPQVNTTNATLGGTLQTAIIENLPMNARNYQNLLALRPGMTIYSGGGGWTQSTNGIRAHDNVYMVEGIVNNDPWMAQSIYNAAMATGDAGTIFSVDAINEFKIEQNPSAQYGWKPGSVINIGVKTGTNAVHGTAYAYGRDTSFNARNYFNPAVFEGLPFPKQPVALEQFGGTVGGPIKKDKLFYFLNYEDQRYGIGNPVIHSVPITAPAAATGPNSLIGACLNAGAKVTALSEELAGLTAGCAINPTRQSVDSQGNHFQGLFPLNSGTNGLSQVGDLVTNNQIDSGLAKFDYHISNHHAIEGMYFVSQSVPLGAVDAPGNQVSTNWLTAQYARAQVGSGAWVWTPNSNWVNQLRFGYSHYYQRFLSTDATDEPASYNFNGLTFVMPTGITNPFYFGLPGITFQGAINGNVFAMGMGWPKVVGPNAVTQITDHISYLHGKHSLLFGGDVLLNQSTNAVTANGKGPLRFTNLTSFFEGLPNRVRLFTGNPVRNLSNQGYALLVQDDWRVTTRLVLNLGVRYEVNTVMGDSNDQLGNFDPIRGLVQVGAGITTPYNGDHNNFAPRLGLAWDIRGNGKTVVRVGGSIIYEQLSYDVFNGIGNLLGLRTIPTGLPLFNAGSTTPLPIAGNITAASTQFTGPALAPIEANWASFNPANPIGPANPPLYASLASPACGDGFTLPPTGGFLAPPAPCSTVSVDRNLRTPYVSTWLLDFQRAITTNLSLDVAYVANHGTKLVGMNDINQPSIGAGWTSAAKAGCLASAPAYDNCAPDTLAEQAARPFTAPCAATINTNNGGPFAPLGANTSGSQFNPNNSCFSYLQYIDIIHNRDTSNYNGLQVVVTQRTSHGLSFTAGYTYAHTLDESSDNWGNGMVLPNNNYAPNKILYASSNFDIRHRFTLSATYEIPGKKHSAQMMEGWSLNTVVTLQSGLPWGLGDFTNDFTGTGEAQNPADAQGEQWIFFGNPKDFTPIHGWTDTNGGWQDGGGGLPAYGSANFNGIPSQNALPPACLNAAKQLDGGAATGLAQATLANIGCYAVGDSVLIPAPFGNTGTTGRNIFRDGGFHDWDFSIGKQFIFKERVTAQFRVAFFNILNKPIWANPFGGPGGSIPDPSSQPFGFVAATPDTYASNPQLGTGGARAMQLGLKLLF